MAITYVSNSLITQGNYPLDARTVTTFDQMPNIEYPFVGMQVYVTEEESTYLINEDCLTTSGRKTVFKGVDELRKHCVKIATSDNILAMIDGEIEIGTSAPGYEKRYCLGTVDAPDFSVVKNDPDPDNWVLGRMEADPDNGRFVWSIEGRLMWDASSKSYVLDENGWSDPARETPTDGAKGEDGTKFTVLGTYATESDLKANVTNPSQGDAYLVGTDESSYILWMYDSVKGWMNLGPFAGVAGPAGDPAWRSITKFVFTSTADNADPSVAPAKPVGGEYNFDNGLFTIPNDWQIIDSNLAKPIWMSNRLFAEDGHGDNAWSDPIMITGADGSNGEDGVGIEYAYKRVKSENEAPQDTPGTIVEGGSDGNGWYDNPRGVNETETCEYVSIRTGYEGSWTSWSTPSLWSKYGVNGLDGDGVEYIYYISNNPVAPVNPTPKNYSTLESYQNNEWLPKSMSSSYINVNSETVNDKDIWSDNPMDVDLNNKYEYVSVRKRTNETWGQFSDPKRWANFAQDGENGPAGESAVVAYVDNPMDSVLLDADGNATAGFPCVTNFHVYKGSEELQVTDLTWIASENLTSGVTVTKGVNKYATLTVSQLPASSNAKVNFTMTATADGKTYIGTFMINKISASAPNIIVDMSNDNINVPCDSDKNILTSTFPIENTINAYKGGEEINITNVTCDNSSVEFTRSGKYLSITSLPSFTDTLDIALNIELEGESTRTVSFRIIKVVPGAPGEDAVFYEMKTNLGTIKVDTNGNIVNSELEASILYRKGSRTTRISVADLPENYKLYYSIDNDNLTYSFPSNGKLDLSEAITGELDLDRFVSLSLTQNGAVIDGPERIYMVHDGTPGAQGPQGIQGPQGPQGEQGIQGEKGEDGQTNYFHVAYADSADGKTNFNHTSGKYIGTYVDEVEADSNNYLDYTWRQFEGAQGPQGAQGIQGENGADGRTQWLHIAYATSDTGANFNVAPFDGATYMGTYVDFNEADSTNPSDYTWTKYVGPSSTIYKLSASDTCIRKSNINETKNTEDIVVSILKISGENSETVSVGSLPSAYEVKYTNSGSTPTRVTLNSMMTIKVNSMNSVSEYVKYDLYYTQTGQSDPILVDSITIPVLADGVEGAAGKIMYFAGEWKSGQLYEADETSTPYVYDENGKDGYNYFFLIRENNNLIKYTSPYSDWDNNNSYDTNSWKPIPNFEVIYSKVGLFDTANVGPAVFYKDWVFSQTDINGGTSYNKFDGDPINGAFKPATWFNFKTGEGSLANGNIYWTKDGDVTFGPDVKLTWDSISDAVNDNFEVPEGGLSEGEVEDIISRTEISGTQIKTGTITANHLAANSITSDKIAAGAITADDIAANAITAAKIAANSITSDKIAAGAITADDIAAGAITAGKISSGAITADKIAAGAITANKVAADVFSAIEIDADQITSGTISADRIDADSMQLKRLNTEPDTNSSNVVIEGNSVTINDSDSQTICLFSDNSLGLSSNTAFRETSSNSKTLYDWDSDSALGTVGYFYTSNSVVTGDINTTSSISAEIGYLTSGQLIKFEWVIPTTIDLRSRLTSSSNYIEISKYVQIDVYCDGTLVGTIGSTAATSSSATGSSANKVLTRIYSGSATYITQSNGTYTFKPKVAGTYKGNLSASGVISQTVDNTTFTVTYGDNNTTCLTSICKDGIIIKNAANGIFMGDNVIMFKMGDYGLKISPTGITYATNLTSYQNGTLNSANWKTLL